jgi:hypothetical protein
LATESQFSKKDLHLQSMHKLLVVDSCMPTVVERGRTLGRERVESMIDPARGGGREGSESEVGKAGAWWGG